MGRKRNRNKAAGWGGDNFWQSAAFNNRVYLKNYWWIMSLAMNRFRWEGLPETCDARFLEYSLLTRGMATIAQPVDEDGNKGPWFSLMVGQWSDIDMYGNPVQWSAMGMNGRTQFDVDVTNGALCWANQTRVPPHNAIEVLARRLTHYERTEDVNLSQMQNPVVWTAPEEMQMILENVYKQAAGGEPAVLGYPSLLKNLEVKAINPGIEYLGEKLQPGKQNAWAEVYRFLGINHLAFEKGERMIEQEAEASVEPTEVKLMDELDARRKCCEELARIGLPGVRVVFNKDVESYNWAYENNLEAQSEVSDNGTV